MAITFQQDGETVTTFEGCVLDEGEENYRDDSDFYAVVWDEESQCVRRTQYATTRFGGGGSCRIDATDEVREKAAAYLRNHLFQQWQRQNEGLARIPEIGRRVRWVKGRPTMKREDGSREKVAMGTEGTVVFREERRSQYGTWSYGFRLGVALSDRRDKGPWTLTREGDELRVSSPYHHGFNLKARALNGNWDRDNKVWVYPASREADVVALYEIEYPGNYLDMVWTNEDNVEVVCPENYQEPEETGLLIAESRCYSWRSATYVPRAGMMFA